VVTAGATTDPGRPVSTIDASPTSPQAPARGAQTVAPVQASALLHAAAILGDGGYVPEQRLGAALTSTARLQDAPVAQPVAGQPVAGQSVAGPAAAAPEEPSEPRRGFWARLWQRLFGG